MCHGMVSKHAYTTAFYGCVKGKDPIIGSKVILVLGLNIKQYIRHWIHDNIAKHLEAGNIFYLSNKPFLFPKTCFLSLLS